MHIWFLLCVSGYDVVQNSLLMTEFSVFISFCSTVSNSFVCFFFFFTVHYLIIMWLQAQLCTLVSVLMNSLSFVLLKIAQWVDRQPGRRGCQCLFCVKVPSNHLKISMGIFICIASELIWRCLGLLNHVLVIAPTTLLGSKRPKLVYQDPVVFGCRRILKWATNRWHWILHWRLYKLKSKCITAAVTIFSCHIAHNNHNLPGRIWQIWSTLMTQQFLCRGWYFWLLSLHFYTCSAR